MFHVYEFKTPEICDHKTALMCQLTDITTLRKRRIRGEKIRKSMQYVCKEYNLLHTHTQHCVFNPVQNAHCLSACMQLHL